ncbi:hypothetical protein [Kineococcus sp. SYSU DK005]|uniref:hypothetical protein n=1 Tax=Kineococcus sp. SYSU DK005 TaxID=3383126 RepID=UPI003D7CC82F
MESTTIANVDARTAFDATPAAPCRSAVWGRGHGSTRVMTTGGVRLDALAAQLRGGVEAYRFRGKAITTGSAPRTTVPSSGTSPTSPPV